MSGTVWGQCKERQDHVIQETGRGHKDQQSRWLLVLTGAPKKITLADTAGSAGVGAVLTWVGREGCSEKGHVSPNLNNGETALGRCGGSVPAGPEAPCRTTVSAEWEGLKDTESIGGVEEVLGPSATPQAVLPHLPSFFDEPQAHL